MTSRIVCLLLAAVASTLVGCSASPTATLTAQAPTATHTSTPTDTPTPTLTPSPEDADIAYVKCCAPVFDGFRRVIDAIGTAGAAADTDVFCEAQTEWGSTVTQLRARHAECPRPADSRLLSGLGLLDISLDELEQATGLYGGFCRTQDLHLADDANQSLQEAVSHATQAYEALTGQPTAQPTPDDVNAAWVECVSDVLLGLWDLSDDFESAPEAHSFGEFCAPIAGWATSLEAIQAKYALCTAPTDSCLLAEQEPLEACLAELGAAFQYYGEACAKDDDSLVQEGNRHFLDALAYLEQTSEAVRQCGG